MDHLTWKNSFRYSVKRSIPILIGYFPLGVAFGILMAQAGYSFLWSAGSSVLVYAGSLQMLLPSFFTQSLPLVTIVITTLLLNSRHIFYGLSFIEKFRSYGPWKYFLIYALTDENYSLLCSYHDREGLSEKWVHIFSSALTWFYWVAFSALGGIIGQMLTFDTTGIDFALTALFVVIFIDQLKSAQTRLPGFIAILSSVLCILLLGPDHFLLPSLIVTVAVLFALRNHLEPKEGNPS